MDLRLLSQCQARSIDLGHPGLRCGLLLSICKLIMGSVIAYAFQLIISYAVADTFVYSITEECRHSHRPFDHTTMTDVLVKGYVL